MLKRKSAFDDLRLTMQPKVNFKEKQTIKYEKSILNEQRYYDFFFQDENKGSLSEA